MITSLRPIITDIRKSRVTGGAVEQGMVNSPAGGYLSASGSRLPASGGHAHQHPAVERRQDPRCEDRAPLGCPVDPDVYMMVA